MDKQEFGIPPMEVNDKMVFTVPARLYDEMVSRHDFMIRRMNEHAESGRYHFRHDFPMSKVLDRAYVDGGDCDSETGEVLTVHIICDSGKEVRGLLRRIGEASSPKHPIARMMGDYRSENNAERLLERYKANKASYERCCEEVLEEWHLDFREWRAYKENLPYDDEEDLLYSSWEDMFMKDSEYQGVTEGLFYAKVNRWQAISDGLYDGDASKLLREYSEWAADADVASRPEFESVRAFAEAKGIPYSVVLYDLMDVDMRNAALACA